MIQISITDNTGEVQRELRQIASQLARPVAMYKDIGRGLANDLKKHFAARNTANPNKLGGARTNWWLGVRDAVQTQPQIVADGVMVAIAHPTLAARVFGATVTPKRARALTIPIHRLAYGRRASTFERSRTQNFSALKASACSWRTSTGRCCRSMRWSSRRRSRVIQMHCQKLRFC